MKIEVLEKLELFLADVSTPHTLASDEALEFESTCFGDVQDEWFLQAYLISFGPTHWQHSCTPRPGASTLDITRLLSVCSTERSPAWRSCNFWEVARFI